MWSLESFGHYLHLHFLRVPGGLTSLQWYLKSQCIQAHPWSESSRSNRKRVREGRRKETRQERKEEGDAGWSFRLRQSSSRGQNSGHSCENEKKDSWRNKERLGGCTCRDCKVMRFAWWVFSFLGWEFHSVHRRSGVLENTSNSGLGYKGNMHQRETETISAHLEKNAKTC